MFENGSPIETFASTKYSLMLGVVLASKQWNNWAVFFFWSLSQARACHRRTFSQAHRYSQFLSRFVSHFLRYVCFSSEASTNFCQACIAYHFFWGGGSAMLKETQMTWWVNNHSHTMDKILRTPFCQLSEYLTLCFFCLFFVCFFQRKSKRSRKN